MQNTPGIQWQSPSVVSLSIILMHFLQSSCPLATRERMMMAVLRGSWWKMCSWKRYSADSSTGSIDMGCWRGWYRLLVAQRKTIGEEQGGWVGGAGALMAQLTLSDSSNSQMAFVSWANCFSHQQKRQPREEETFQLQQLELQCRTHMNKHTFKHTHTHKVHMGLVRVQRPSFSVNQSRAVGTYTAAFYLITRR